jgi:uncharacterized Zn-binding protein involved in type VI secretion
MAIPLIRLGDTSTHGGVVVTASADGFGEGPPVARLGDLLVCPKHGTKPIVSGSGKALLNGRPVARMGDKAACGAVLISTATKTRVG